MIFWLGVSLGASAFWALILTWSDRNHERRLWPPRSGNWITGAWAWGLTILIYVGLINTATADWNALGWPAWLRWAGAIAAAIASTLVQGRGVRDLGLGGTSGWDVGVVTTGAYAWMRHPQYLGQIISLIGLAWFGANGWAFLAAAVGSVTLVYAGHVEERFLSRRHPRDYGAYSTRVGPWW